MGKFSCTCGYLLGASPPQVGTTFLLTRDEDRDVVSPPNAGTMTICPNCGRVHLELGGAPPIVTYEHETEAPRVWADFSLRDSYNRVVLLDSRSLADIERQHLILNPPLDLLLYDDDQREVNGEVFFAVTASGEVDDKTWAVALNYEP
jgi:hypothetical protein